MPQRKKAGLEAKLYRDVDQADHWVAWSANIGWQVFWARPNGWAEREPLAELGAIRLCEVPLAEAFNSDVLAAFRRPPPRALTG